MTGPGSEGVAAPISALSGTPEPSTTQSPASRRQSYQAAATAFVVLFCIVGVALWGLPFYYDFMVQQFGWTRAQVTSGNALSKLVVGPIFGFLAGWVVDRFGPRRMMMIGILMAGVALVGLGWISSLGMFYFFYFFNALGYVCGGPLPNQVLLTQWFDRSRGKAMGFAYLGIGIGGATVPWISHVLVQHFGWQAALRILGFSIVVVSLPLAMLGERTATSKNKLWIGRVRESEGSIQASVVLSAHPGKHVLDCRSQWHAAESEAFLESRPALHAAGCRRRLIAGAGFQYRRPVTHGLACGSLFQEVRHAADVLARRCGHPSAVPRNYPASRSMFPPRFLASVLVATT